MLKQHLFSAGELLRMNQLAPDRAALDAQLKPQPDLLWLCFACGVARRCRTAA